MTNSSALLTSDESELLNCEQELLALEEEDLQRRMARKNLLPFATYTKPTYRTNWHHQRLAEALDRVAEGKCRRLMVFMPPQHGKSELVSRRFPAYILGRDPDMRIIGTSHTADLANSMNRDVQRIMTSERYGNLFPKSCLNDKWVRSSSRMAARRTMDLFEIVGYAGGLRSAGVGGSIAGNPADGAIIDDPFGKREDADSAVTRQKIWEWYTNDLYARLSADAWIVLTHTRWHRDDLAGRLLRKMLDPRNDQWEVLSFPAVRVEGTNDPLDPRLPGEPLWPAHKNSRDLDIVREQDRKAFAALYQQDPAEAGGNEWAPEYFGSDIWCKEEHWPQQFDVSAISCDPSRGSESKLGDYNANVFIGRHNGMFYVDCDMDRRNARDVVRAVRTFGNKYRPDGIGFETDQFQMLLKDQMEAEDAGMMQAFVVLKMPTGGKKKTFRILRLSPYITGRRFKFRETPGCRLLVDQLMDWPTAEHDDGPDSLEQGVRVIYHLLGIDGEE